MHNTTLQFIHTHRGKLSFSSFFLFFFNKKYNFVKIPYIYNLQNLIL